LIARTALPAVAFATVLLPHAAMAADSVLTPGLYEVTFTLELPNVATTGIGPGTVRHCITAASLASGEAFAILSDNPLRACPVVDYVLERDRARYRVACAGPNAPRATGTFDLTANGYRGAINMDMGGKNMTMSERHRARRLGSCPG
jgi:hypothetical protein